MKTTAWFLQNVSHSVRMIALALLALSLAVCAQAQTLSYLAVFNGTNGSGPSTVIQATDGNFYGTTLLHSFTYGPGTDPNTLKVPKGLSAFTTPPPWVPIYQITPAGAYTTLHNFTYGGSTVPYTGLYQAPDGNFYGAIEYYGNNSNGAEYSFSYNLGPLVQTVPLRGTVGTSVNILGNGLTGSSSVTFNGVEAAFTVESDTYIKATVPAGAKTGKVSVVTPSGTLNSNPQFVVTK